MTDAPPPAVSSRPATRWRLRPPAPPSEVAVLSRELGVPPLLASVLWSRGLRGDAALHLSPPLEPTAIPDLDAAAARLEHALRAKRRILIHGDYDADGITGTAVLTLGLRALGADVTPFLPNRLTDGYGIHPNRVPEHAERADLLLTVDCGISNLAEIRALQEAGVEVIVTDHHHPGAELPACLIVHPRTSPLARKGLPELTGAGVAYHLLWALHARLGLEPPLDHADLAAIGTIADVAPLLGENRALVLAGLERLADSRWPGVRAMVAQSRLRGAPSARDVAFVLAPRLNAAGRLGEAELGLEMLTTSSERRARELAVYLDARNQERRRIQDEMAEQAYALVDPEAPAIVVDHPEWHPGVMGIVASKIVERHYKPVFIVAKGKGSVRSTPGISAVGALHAAAAHLERFGGHAQAAGFAIRQEAIPAFREAICAWVAQHEPPVPTVVADALLSAGEVDRGLYGALQRLEPYGEGHPSPLFALTDTLERARAVGRTGETLQLHVGGVKGVAWRMGELASRLTPGSAVNAAVSLRENEWNGSVTLEFVADDVRPAAPLELDGDDEAPSWLRRGTAPAGTREARDAAGLAAAGDEPVVLRALPLGEDMDVAGPMRSRLRRAADTWFDLDAAALREVEHALLRFPSVHELRRAVVCLQRGQRLPFAEAKNALVRRALEELELLDPATGRVLRGVKRDPYRSETLLHGVTERYRLQQFLHAYRHLDDAGFARATLTLFGDPG